jgi:membrane associated rhomboid family serine protease
LHAQCVEKGSCMRPKFNFSSPQRRGPSDPWFRVGQVEVTTTVFVVALGVLSMFVFAASRAFFEPLYLITERVRSGQLWRLITWPIANDPNFSAVITLAVFWYFGRSLEQMFGRLRFTYFLLAIAIIPAVVLALLSFVSPSLRVQAIGLSLIELGVFVAYVAEQPNARFFFGIKAWVIAVVIVGIEVLQLISYRDAGALLLLLFILAMSLLLTRAYGFAADQAWIPKLALPTKTKSKTFKPVKGSPVVRGPWGESGLPVNDMASQAEMDRLLDKIAASGMDSLTVEEKRRLKAHSKRLRGDG